jgi:hypothetical protein
MQQFFNPSARITRHDGLSFLPRGRQAHLGGSLQFQRGQMDHTSSEEGGDWISVLGGDHALAIGGIPGRARWRDLRGGDIRAWTRGRPKHMEQDLDQPEDRITHQGSIEKVAAIAAQCLAYALSQSSAQLGNNSVGL